MIEIKEASIADITTIQNIAYRTWPDTFGAIIPADQLTYMLDMMYSEASLIDQINVKGHKFYLAYEENEAIGYISIEPNYQGSTQTKIHKIYILPRYQGKGIGRLLLDHAQSIAKAEHNSTLLLNVNRENKAVFFYEKYGFAIVKNQDIPIGNGYFMIDFVMKKDM